MKKEPFLFILKLYAVYLLAFLGFKPLFMLCNAPEPLHIADMLQVLWHAIPMDLATASYFMVLPLLLTLLACWANLAGKALRTALTVYFALTALTIATALCTDSVLYGFWNFKLDATVLNYMDSPKDALASVSPWMVAGGVAAIIALAAGLTLLLRLAARRFASATLRPATPALRAAQTLLLIVAGGLLFVAMRGGLSESTMNVGQAYYSDNQFLNHSAVNPLFSLGSSALKAKDLGSQYQFYSEEERARHYAELHMPSPASNPAPITPAAQPILRSPRPNVVVVIMEGLCASFMEPLGGDKGVTPCLNAMAQEGLLFSQCYANSFRTDRGTVSILSGYPSFPDLSVMKLPQKTRALPSLAASLKEAGYATAFLYGGDVNFTNMKSYLLATGYEQVEGSTHFTPAARATHAWGAQDHIVLDTLAHHILSRSASHAPFFLTCLTLSSHEPWQVPCHRLPDNPKANAMAYTDSCLGALVATLRSSPAWSNLLLVLVADHGITYPDGITEANPAKSHIPMLWTGGALLRHGTAAAYCNQSDLAATLLAAMSLPTAPYPFSRNVLSPAYSYPFAVHTFAGGIAYMDATGATVYDLTARKVLTDTPAPSPLRLSRAKTYLQTTMQHLLRLGGTPAPTRR